MDLEATDAIYARQSVDKADSISIESQIEFCRYETRGAPCRIFADKGYSGKNTDRPEFQKMLRQIRQGKIRRVICYKLDRCSRSILDFTALMEEFRKFGVEFVSCTEKFDTSTPMGRAMLNICIVFAQLERETIQQRVCDAYRSRSRKGFYMGGKVPFGFQMEACTLEGKHTSRFREEPAEAEILRFLYEEYAKPSVSLGDLVASLHQKGISNPRRSDGHWVRSHIGRMLANPIYARADMDLYRYFQKLGITICNDPADFIGTNGCYLYRGKDQEKLLVLAPHEGLVSAELWLKCRKTRSIPKRNTGGQTGSWLTGHLFCGNCGHHLVISGTKGQNGKQYRYIVCPHSHGADSCCPGLKGWKAETAESLLADLIIGHLQTHYPVLTAPDSGECQQNMHDITIAQIRREMEQTGAKALQAGPDLLPYLNAHIHQLEQKKAVILQKMQSKLSEESPHFRPDYPHRWSSLSRMQKQQILDALISQITLSESVMTVNWRLPPSA